MPLTFQDFICNWSTIKFDLIPIRIIRLPWITAIPINPWHTCGEPISGNLSLSPVTKKGRYYGHIKTIFGRRGFDILQDGNFFSYGGNIYRNEEDRPFSTGTSIGQGNTADSFYAETEIGYIVNPATNLKFFGSFIFRSFQPELSTAAVVPETTTWLRLGLRTDIFNWYFDY